MNPTRVHFAISRPCFDAASSTPRGLTGRLHPYLITNYHHPVWSEWFTRNDSPPSSMARSYIQ